jgi:hypothetical protein
MYMGERYGNNPDLNNKVKKNLLVLLGTILLFLQIFAVQAAPQAIFVTQGSENVRTSGNDFYHGTYPAQYGYFVSIQNSPDDSGTVLGNIVYAIDADNIIEYDQMQHAHKDGTSIQWVFPENVSLGENTFIYSNAATDYIYQRYIPITVHRWTNRSVFSSDGYQLASFSVSYDNLSLNDANVTFDHVFGSISTNEHSKFNASIVPGSFTTTMPIINNPMARNDSHRFSFSNSTPIGINQVYNFSVVIHIHLKDPTASVIEYYPGFSTSLMGGTSSFDPVSSFNANSPSYMLPKYAHSANGSTNISNQWYYSFGFSRGVNLNENLKSSNLSITSQKIGVYRPGVGFYLKMDNGNTWNPSTDQYLAWDNAVVDRPIAGDWNMDGRAETGVYRPGVGFYLKMDNGSTWTPSTDVYLAWDNAAVDRPIAGDWNMDGRAETGVYRPGVGFYLKMDNGSTWTPSTEVYLAWDNAAVDRPIAGDWNADGRAETGVYRPGVGFYLKMDNGSTWNPSTDKYLAWDNAVGDLPIAGNFV